MADEQGNKAGYKHKIKLRSYNQWFLAMIHRRYFSFGKILENFPEEDCHLPPTMVERGQENLQFY